MSPSDISVSQLWIAFAISFALLAATVALMPGLRRVLRDPQRSGRNAGRPQDSENQEFAEAAPVIAYLLRSGFRGAWVRLRPAGSDSKLAIQFDKYIRGPGDYGIELVFPVLKWSREYAPQVEGYCQDQDLPLRIRPKLSSHAREAIFVDCGQDPERAFELARHIWVEIFGLEASAPHRIERYGLSTDGELVDKPDQKPLSFSEA